MIDVLSDAPRAPQETDNEPIAPVAPSSVPAWRERAPWLIPVLPWLWFVIRGIHPVIEVLAILLPLATLGLGAASLLAATFWRRWEFAALALSSVAFFGVAVLLPGRPIDGPEPSESIRVVSMNVGQQWFSNNDVGYFASNNAVDLFVGVDLSATHDQELREQYVNGISDLVDSEPDPLPVDGTPNPEGTYRRNGHPSIGVYSDLDIELLSDPIADEIDGGLPGFRVLVRGEQTDYIVYALHIPRAGFGGGDTYEVGITDQRRIIEAIVRAADQESLPVMIVGDLNVVDRGASYGLLTSNLHDAMRQQRWARRTRARSLWHTLLFLRIDHLLIDDDLCVQGTPEAPDVMFTDHTPILADIGPCTAS